METSESVTSTDWGQELTRIGKALLSQIVVLFLLGTLRDDDDDDDDDYRRLSTEMWLVETTRLNTVKCVNALFFIF